MDKELPSAEQLSKNLSFIRWVKGTANTKEMRRWDRWVNESAQHQEIAQKAQQEILGVDFITSHKQNVSSEWDKLENRIEQSDRSKKFKLPQVGSSSKRGGLLRIAAVLLLAAITGLSAYFMFADTTSTENTDTRQVEWKKIETDFQQQKTVALSDGSTITLSANSSITYPAGWMRGSVTEVYLKGEAYFAITNRKDGKQPPFKVLTNDGIIEVMGTRFVVANSAEDTRVGLEEGKVAIQKRNSTAGSSVTQSYVMEPNQVAYFSRETSEVNINNHPNLEVFTSWIDQKIVLDSSKLSYLIYRIEHTYGVQVEVQNEDLYQRRLTGTIQMKDLEYVIQSISKVIDEDVTVKNGTVYFGTRNLTRGG